MAEYLAPGVYIEEIDVGAKPIEGVSTSTVGFLGQTERGAVEPRLVTSFEQYQRIYGGYLEYSYLTYAVEGFFNNGGKRCYIARIVGSERERKASLPLDQVIEVEALPGHENDNIQIQISDAEVPKMFKLTVIPNHNDSTKNETFDCLCTKEVCSCFCETIINGAKNNPKGSKYVTVKAKGNNDGQTIPGKCDPKLLSSFTSDAIEVKALTGQENDNIQIQISDSEVPKMFKLTVIPNPNDLAKNEYFDCLCTKEGCSSYCETIVNKTEANPTGSSYVRVTVIGNKDGKERPAESLKVPLVKTGGESTPANRTFGAEEKGIITLTAIGPGLWGNKIFVKLEEGSLNTKTKSLYKMSVAYGQGDIDHIVEVFDNFSLDSKSSDGYLKRINGVSNYITMDYKELKEGGSPSTGDDFYKLENGDEDKEDNRPTVKLKDFKGKGDDDPSKRTGLLALKAIDDISIICAPDDVNVDELMGELINQCQDLKDRFAIINAKQAQKPSPDIKPSKVNSKYAAIYYPWIRVNDPLTSTSRLIPPCGHIAGVYARVDTERGVHKAPANEVLRGAIGLEFNLNSQEQETLNPKGINCIRLFPGRGIRVWGARTVSSDSSWKYVNVRRLFIFLEKSIDVNTQWAVFEPNDEKLWARMRQTINQFLTTQWRAGALMGSTQDEAFFVKCDRTTMTQDDIDNGRLIMVIGVAPVKPAEFVIFRIAQVAKGSEIAE